MNESSHIVLAILGLSASNTTLVVVGALLVIALVLVIGGVMIWRGKGKKKKNTQDAANNSNDWQRQNQPGAAGPWNQQSGSGNAWGQGQPAQGQPAAAWNGQQQQGWNGQNPAQQPQANAWGAANPAANAWGAQDPAQQQQANAWGAQDPAQQQQANAWGAQQPLPQQANPWAAANTGQPQQQANAWGAQDPAQQQQANPWAAQQPAPTANPWAATNAAQQQQQPANPWAAPQQPAAAPWEAAPAPAAQDAWGQQQAGQQGWGAQGSASSPLQQAPGQFSGGNANQGWGQAQPAADPWGQPAAAQPFQAASANSGVAGWPQQPGGFVPDSDKTMMRPSGAPMPSGMPGAGSLGYVRVEEGKEPGRVYEVRKDSLSIGRSRESDIFLEDLAVSRLHATIVNMNNGTYVLKDEGSANGTKVNGQVVNKFQTYPLQEGDRIQLGQTVLVFARK